MDEIRRQANRRAAFITHLLFTLLALPLLTIHWFKTALRYQHIITDAAGTVRGELWMNAGGYGMVGVLIAVIVFAFFTHLAIYGYQRREDIDQALGKRWQSIAEALRRRRALLTLHLGSAAAFFIGVSAYFNDYQHYRVVFDNPSVSNSVREVIYTYPGSSLDMVAIIFLVSVIPHVFWWIYRELSDRTVKHAVVESEKQKNEVFASGEDWQIGDDGELWEITEQQEKRLTQQ